MFRRTTPSTLVNPQRRVRLMVARFLILCLVLQAITPPAMAAPNGPSPITAAVGSAPARVLATLATVEDSLMVFLRATFATQEQWNVVLTPVATEFNEYAGLDYHHSSRKLLLAANAPGGQPNNFEAVAVDGSRSTFSNVARLRIRLPRARWRRYVRPCVLPARSSATGLVRPSQRDGARATQRANQRAVCPTASAAEAG